MRLLSNFPVQMFIFNPPSSVIRLLAQISDSIFSRFVVRNRNRNRIWHPKRTTNPPTATRVPGSPPVRLSIPSFSALSDGISLMCLCPPVHNYYLGHTALAFVSPSSSVIFFGPSEWKTVSRKKCFTPPLLGNDLDFQQEH